MESQLNILAESLDKKLEVLKEIQAYNEEQEKSFTCGRADLDNFDVAVEKKGQLIEKLQRLDAGFETMYAKLSEELKGNRERYAKQIKVLKQKVSEVFSYHFPCNHKPCYRRHKCSASRRCTSLGLTLGFFLYKGKGLSCLLLGINHLQLLNSPIP